jgi:peptidoglycan hydrolase-like protein with peptidoglycan-binding domain
MTRKIFLGTILFFALFLLVTPTHAGLEAEIREDLNSIKSRLNVLLTEVEDLLKGDMVVATFPGIPKEFRFTRHLRFRDKGIDVKYLQIILNADPATRLASSGVGSPGNEVDTFGNITLNAVKKFQQKYASEILHPWGITAPTGIVEIQTVKKLNKILEGEVVIRIIDPVKRAEIQKKLLDLLKDLQDLRKKINELEDLKDGAADAPTNLRAAIIGYGEVRLTWRGDKNAEYFVGYKAKRSGGPYTEAGITEKTNGIVTGLEKGTHYLVVTQVVRGKESGYSREVKIIMDLDPAPYNIKTKASDVGELTLTWDTDQSNVTKYRIYRGSKAGGPYSLLGESTRKSFVDTTAGLQALHYYVVTQVVAGEESDYSTEHIDSWFYNFQGGSYPHPEKETILDNLEYK